MRTILVYIFREYSLQQQVFVFGIDVQADLHDRKRFDLRHDWEIAWTVLLDLKPSYS